jgi:dipeptidyl aminopeptidase/acylaminoacyl peptidase
MSSRARRRTSTLLIAGIALSSVAAIVQARLLARQSPITSVTMPVISEKASPLETIAPVASDGHRGQGFLRKPPGDGPFPAVVIIHGGLATRPLNDVRQIALSAQPSRYLAAGYVISVITYRSRDDDPQSPVSRTDSVAAVEHLRQLPYVDRESIVASGCSGGGDLAIEIAAATNVAAVVAEEPASVLLTGVFNKSNPKGGDRYTPLDAAPISANPKQFYTAPYQKATREKLSRIRAPILILQGDQQPINHYNADVLIPELRSLKKNVQVMTYPGEPHCFAFYGGGPRTPRPAVAQKAMDDTLKFLQPVVRAKPKAIESALVTYVAVESR